MAKLQVSDSLNRGDNSGGDSTIENHNGTPDTIVERVLNLVEKNNCFLQKRIAQKEIHISSQAQSLSEKDETIKALIKELTTVSKQNEETRTMLADKFDELTERIDKVFEFAKNHDLGCKKNHIDLKETLVKNK